jgi:hypothetical protein
MSHSQFDIFIYHSFVVLFQKKARLLRVVLKNSVVRQVVDVL